MSRLKRLTKITGLLVLGAMTNAMALKGREVTLSPAEKRIVDQKIAALKWKAERNLAKSWSNAKKVAEFLCRPAAISSLKKYAPRTDRVFLGTDDPKILTLKSNNLLIGRGEFRTPRGWQSFSFTCELDPTTGKVINFRPLLAPTE